MTCRPTPIVTPDLIRGPAGPTHHTPEMRGRDWLAPLALLVAIVLANATLPWLLTPPAPPAPHYCFRADPPPCQLTVAP